MAVPPSTKTAGMVTSSSEQYNQPTRLRRHARFTLIELLNEPIRPEANRDVHSRIGAGRAAPAVATERSPQRGVAARSSACREAKRFSTSAAGSPSSHAQWPARPVRPGGPSASNATPASSKRPVDRPPRPEKPTSVELQARRCPGSSPSTDEWGTFDLVHARFLLEHVSDPLAVVRSMARAVRPGGPDRPGR